MKATAIGLGRILVSTYYSKTSMKTVLSLALFATLFALVCCQDTPIPDPAVLQCVDQAATQDTVLMQCLQHFMNRQQNAVSIYITLWLLICLHLHACCMYCTIMSCVHSISLALLELIIFACLSLQTSLAVYCGTDCVSVVETAYITCNSQNPNIVTKGNNVCIFSLLNIIVVIVYHGFILMMNGMRVSI